MKKNFKIIFALVSLFALLLPITYSYATTKIQEDKKEKPFFEISKLEITKSQKIEMSLNLDIIKYDEFIFELKSDEVIKEVKITENVTAKKNDNEIVMEVNKEKANVKTINLYYEIPENKKVGDIIKFVATITKVEKVENESKVENTNNIEDSIIETTDKEQITPKQEETQTIVLEVKIIEEKDSKDEEQILNIENKQEISNNQVINKNDMPSVTNKKETMQNIPTNYSNMQYSGIISSQAPKVTYNGSNNNYLSELLVEGYSLNKDFSKEDSTYFVTVENEVESLKILAVVEENTANWCIYGNENLKSGTNKILISVTAENGNVRNYRIYVTKKV